MERLEHCNMTTCKKYAYHGPLDSLVRLIHLYLEGNLQQDWNNHMGFPQEVWDAPSNLVLAVRYVPFGPLYCTIHQAAEGKKEKKRFSYLAWPGLLPHVFICEYGYFMPYLTSASYCGVFKGWDKITLMKKNNSFISTPDTKIL